VKKARTKPKPSSGSNPVPGPFLPAATARPERLLAVILLSHRESDRKLYGSRSGKGAYETVVNSEPSVAECEGSSAALHR